MSNITIEQNNDKFRGMWTPNTFYRQDDMVFDGTSLWVALADFTSGATFNELNWFCPECGAPPPMDTYWIKGRDDGYYQGIDFSGQTSHNSSILPDGYLLDTVGGGGSGTWGVNVFFVPFLISNGLEMELTRQCISLSGDVGSGDDMPATFKVGRRFNFGFVFNVDKDTVSMFTGVGGRYSIVQTTNDLIGVGLARGSEYSGRMAGFSETYSPSLDALSVYDHPSGSDVQHGVFKLTLVRGAVYWIAKVFLNGVEVISHDTVVEHAATTSAMGYIHSAANAENTRVIEKITDITVQDII